MSVDKRLHLNMTLFDKDGKGFDYLSVAIKSFNEALPIIQQYLLIRPYILEDVVEKVTIELEWK